MVHAVLSIANGLVLENGVTSVDQDRIVTLGTVWWSARQLMRNFALTVGVSTVIILGVPMYILASASLAKPCRDSFHYFGGMLHLNPKLFSHPRLRTLPKTKLIGVAGTPIWVARGSWLVARGWLKVALSLID